MKPVHWASFAFLLPVPFLVGHPTPVFEPIAVEDLDDQGPVKTEAAPESGIDWSKVLPSFPDLSGVFSTPLDPTDPWLEPERFTNCSVVACIALTFDDGPLPPHTEEVLKILKDYDVPATFFLVGRMVNSYPEVVLDLKADGHEIGAHSYAHSRLTELGSEKLASDFQRTNEAIEAVTGQAPAFYRPPYGMHNQRVRDVAGMATIMWSIDPQDWRKSNSSSDVLSYVLRWAHPGAIVLFHDKMSKTAQALPQIIKGLREQGYELVTLSEILGTKLDAAAVYKSGFAPPEVTDASGS